MKPGRDAAQRWLRQAEHDWRIARGHHERADYSDACFMAEQSAQVALKSFIISQKKRFVWEHSIQELAIVSSRYDKDFEKIIEDGKILDRYYIPTRYPDALATPAVPYKSYLEKDAAEAIDIAERILTLVKKKMMLR